MLIALAAICFGIGFAFGWVVHGNVLESESRDPISISELDS